MFFFFLFSCMGVYNWYLFCWVQNRFGLFLKMKQQRSRIPGSTETQYEESETDKSSLSYSSSSEDVSNFKKNHKDVMIFCLEIVLAFLQNQVHSTCEVSFIFMIIGWGGGDREGAGWCNIRGVAKSTLKWGTCIFPETQRRQEVKKGQ